MKKGIILLVLAAVVASGAFAQTHWISGEASILGGGVRYEFMLNDNMSVGGNAYWNSLFFFWNELGIDATFRYYLFDLGKARFFVGAGVGFHIHTSLTDDVWIGVDADISTTGGAITPDVGFRIDVGPTGGFFIQPGIKAPITFGARDVYSSSNVYPWYKIEKKFKVGFGVVPYIGLGYAF